MTTRKRHNHRPQTNLRRRILQGFLDWSAHSGADPGFVERGFIYEGVGVAIADFLSFFINFPWQ